MNDPKMNDDKMTVNATILAIFTEFAWRSLYACKKKKEKKLIIGSL